VARFLVVKPWNGTSAVEIVKVEDDEPLVSGWWDNWNPRTTYGENIGKQ
jgi:D-alanine-D-alanine ligase-like ATP-grasp enzyme